MIVLRSDDEIASIREAGSILAGTLKKLKECVRPGIRTKELDELAAEEILRRKGLPAFKGYKNFPANICTSINEVVVHGIPSARKTSASVPLSSHGRVIHRCPLTACRNQTLW